MTDEDQQQPEQQGIAAEQDAPEIVAADDEPPQEPAESVAAEPEAAEEPAESVSAESTVPAEPESPAEPEAPAESVAAPTEPEAPAEEVAAPVADVALDAPSVRRDVAWWPFLVYLGLWVVFSAVVVWQLLPTPKGAPVYDADIYPYVLLAGLILTGAGPALILAVWVSQMRSDGGNGSRFASAIAKGGVVTLVGVALWWVALIVLDVLRLGRPF